MNMHRFSKWWGAAAALCGAVLSSTVGAQEQENPRRPERQRVRIERRAESGQGQEAQRGVPQQAQVEVLRRRLEAMQERIRDLRDQVQRRMQERRGAAAQQRGRPEPRFGGPSFAHRRAAMRFLVRERLLQRYGEQLRGQGRERVNRQDRRAEGWEARPGGARRGPGMAPTGRRDPGDERGDRGLRSARPRGPKNGQAPESPPEPRRDTGGGERRGRNRAGRGDAGPEV
jgi:TolA-binding protein